MPIYDLTFKAQGHDITVGVIADSAQKAIEAFEINHPLAEIVGCVEAKDATDPVVRI
jgi:hypothetical protein